MLSIIQGEKGSNVGELCIINRKKHLPIHFAPVIAVYVCVRVLKPHINRDRGDIGLQITLVPKVL